MLARRLLTLASLLLVMAVGLGAAAEQEPFSFALPPGFLDLSKGAPAESFERVAPPIVERARGFQRYAVSLVDEQPRAEITVTIESSHGNVAETVDGIKRGIEKHGAQLLGESAEVIRGVDCARLDLSVTVQGIELRKVIYVLPLGEQRAIITLEVESDLLQSYGASFESSVRSTRGIQPATDASANTHRLATLLMIIGGAGVVGNALRKKKRRGNRPARAKARAPSAED